MTPAERVQHLLKVNPLKGRRLDPYEVTCHLDCLDHPERAALYLLQRATEKNQDKKSAVLRLLGHFLSLEIEVQKEQDELLHHDHN